MQEYIKKLFRFKMTRLIPITMLMIITPVASVHAIEWHKFTRTTRHAVAIDMDSVQRNSSGSLTVLLRFTPRGEFQRRAAATEYGNKNYMLHLEQYQLDCAKKSAQLDFIDILDWKDKSILKLPGSAKRDTIKPDSVLDRVAGLVCPGEEAGDDDGNSPDSAAVPAMDGYFSDIPLSMEQRKRIDDAQRLAAAEPDNAATWVELGNAWYDAGMAKQAISAYDHALKLKPNDSNVLNDQGAMYRQAGDTQHALANFEKALAIDPNNLESLYNMGYVYAFDLNDSEHAQEIWQRYLQLDNTSETAEEIRTYLNRSATTPELR